MEQYADIFISSHGKLRIVFDSNYLILFYEFCSYEHQENQSSEVCYTQINEFGITPHFSRALIVSFYISNII